VFAAVLDAQVAELAKRAGPVRRPVDPVEAVRDLMPGACRNVLRHPTDEHLHVPGH
jgi:hypothetical protein